MFHRNEDNTCRPLVETLAAALDARDGYTAGHSLRVSAYAVGIAAGMGLCERDREIIRTGAQLHDLGKIGIPDAVLLKPGPLTSEEYALIQLHPQIGRRILEKSPGFYDILEIVELHHENFDGTGYPYGLARQKIPLHARVVRAADALDAMTTDRAHRPARNVQGALEEIARYSGTQFDPDVARALLDLMGGPMRHDGATGLYRMARAVEAPEEGSGQKETPAPALAGQGSRIGTRRRV